MLDALNQYGGARGWAADTLRRARRALIAGLTSGHDLGQPPWDAGHLRRFLVSRHPVALRVIEFLTDQGLCRASPRATLDLWLGRRLAALPSAFAPEVRIWTEALRGCGPRAGRSRHPRTIEAYLRVLRIPLAAWAVRYGSLRQVTTEDLTAQLALLTGATRLLALAAMRSLFATLKARRVLFADPAAPLTGRALQPPPVLPLDDTMRARLLSQGLAQNAEYARRKDKPNTWIPARRSSDSGRPACRAIDRTRRRRTALHHGMTLRSTTGLRGTSHIGVAAREAITWAMTRHPGRTR